MAAQFRRTSNITSNYLMAMILAGVVAAGGLWTATVHIVVGAMVIAPGFEPILRIPFGLIAREHEAWIQGFVHRRRLCGNDRRGGRLPASDVAQRSSGLALDERRWIGYWSEITRPAVAIARGAGAAGAAIIAAHRSVLTAGVMIALGLVPALRSSGWRSHPEMLRLPARASRVGRSMQPA